MPSYFTWQYLLDVFSECVSVTSQLTAESRIDQAEKAQGQGLLLLTINPILIDQPASSRLNWKSYF